MARFGPSSSAVPTVWSKADRRSTEGVELLESMGDMGIQGLDWCAEGRDAVVSGLNCKDLKCGPRPSISNSEIFSSSWRGLKALSLKIAGFICEIKCAEVGRHAVSVFPTGEWIATGAGITR